MTTLGPMILGGGQFGGLGSPPSMYGLGLDEADAHIVLDRAVDLGLSVVDTAHSYGGGACQRMVGSWLRADADRRARMRILDKVGVRVDGEAISVDLSPANVRQQLQDARERMGVAHVDIIAIHAPDEHVPAVDTARVFVETLEAGHASAWGLSNVGPDELTEWLEAADAVGLPDPAIVENGYNLVQREAEQDVLPACRERGITFLAYSPLAMGLLSGKYARNAPPPPGSTAAMRPDMLEGVDDRVHDLVDLVRDIAADHGVAPAAVAIAWLAAQPGVVPIAGPRRPAHLDAVEESLRLRMTPDQLRRLDASTP